MVLDIISEWLGNLNNLTQHITQPISDVSEKVKKTIYRSVKADISIRALDMARQQMLSEKFMQDALAATDCKAALVLIVKQVHTGATPESLQKFA